MSGRNALQFQVFALWRIAVTVPAERMRTMRSRRRALGLREVRIILPDARSLHVRERLARQVASLDAVSEDDALRWIEAVSEFDTPGDTALDETR